jgi:hypothetical protein
MTSVRDRSRVPKVAALALVLVMGCGAVESGQDSTSPTIPPTTSAPATTVPAVATIDGTFTIMEEVLGEAGDVCTGEGGYSDVSSGTEVVVTDQAGEIVGVGRLREGLIIDVNYGCRFEFTVDVPPGLPFYTVEVGRRGELTYTLAEMEADRWFLDLSVGGR